jgi:Flp pilus assembly protein TadD
LSRQGRLEEAESLARAAIDLLEQTDALLMQANALSDLGEMLKLAGRDAEARAALEAAAELYVRKGSQAPAARPAGK